MGLQRHRRAGLDAQGDTSRALVNTASGRCLDIPAASPKNRIQLQIYTCNGSPPSAGRWRS